MRKHGQIIGSKVLSASLFFDILDHEGVQKRKPLILAEPASPPSIVKMAVLHLPLVRGLRQTRVRRHFLQKIGFGSDLLS